MGRGVGGGGGRERTTGGGGERTTGGGGGREQRGVGGGGRERQRQTDRQRAWMINWLTDYTLFLKGEYISRKADWHTCRCYSTTGNEDIHTDMLRWQDINQHSTE